jgi:hypothetical protein
MRIAWETVGANVQRVVAHRRENDPPAGFSPRGSFDPQLNYAE